MEAVPAGSSLFYLRVLLLTPHSCLLTTDINGAVNHQKWGGTAPKIEIYRPIFKLTFSREQISIATRDCIYTDPSYAVKACPSGTFLRMLKGLDCFRRICVQCLHGLRPMRDLQADILKKPSFCSDKNLLHSIVSISSITISGI